MSNEITAELPRGRSAIKEVPFSGKLENYLKDESSNFIGRAEKVFFPRNEDEIAKIFKDAVEKKHKVTISGAGTSLTGSRVPYGGYVISTENLREVDKYHDDNLERMVFNDEETNLDYELYIGYDDKKREFFSIIPPSITLKSFQKALEGKRLFFPVDPTEDSATFGGMVSTNASGGRSLIYGSIRDWIRRIRVVLAEGEVLNIGRGRVHEEGWRFKVASKDGGGKVIDLPIYKMSSVKKNSAGYYIRENSDLIDLFIGSEGTLGVISEVEVKLLKKKEEAFECIAFFPRFEDAIRFIEKTKTFSINCQKRKGTRDLLRPISIEFYDYYSLEFLKKSPGTSLKIPEQSHAAVSFEQGFRDKILDDCLVQWDSLLDEYDCTGTYIAFDDKEYERLRVFRHSLPESVNRFVRERDKSKIATDIAVPDRSLRKMLKFYIEIGSTAQLDRILEKLSLNVYNVNWEQLSASEKTEYILKRIDIDAKSVLDELHLTEGKIRSADMSSKVEFLRRYADVEIAYLYFGHIGDNHIHFNFLPNTDDELELKSLATKLLKKAVELGGTISAEHGVGKKTYIENNVKKPFLELMYSRDTLLSMAKMKNCLDPYHILNIGNIIPEWMLHKA